jgi:branched-chain amino acid aminotransferase
LGVGAATKSKLFVICSPVGPYYKTGFAAVSLLADPQFVRAWPGGVGDYKVGGNYAPTILTQQAAAVQGFQQILWLLPDRRADGQIDHLLTEVGTMNLFVLLKGKNGRELVTPPLDGTILPGVTRDSIIQLVRESPEFKVTDVKRCFTHY